MCYMHQIKYKSICIILIPQEAPKTPKEDGPRVESTNCGLKKTQSWRNQLIIRSQASGSDLLRIVTQKVLQWRRPIHQDTICTSIHQDQIISLKQNIATISLLPFKMYGYINKINQHHHYHYRSPIPSRSCHLCEFYFSTQPNLQTCFPY